MSNLTKRGLAFTPEDMRLIERLRKQLAATQGKTSLITVIRYALREAAK
jgi:hypothetical protein